jgi:hypothetical protein
VLGPALDLIRNLRRAGAQIEADGDNLRVTAVPGVLTESMKAELVARKTEILTLFGEAVRLLNERGARLIPRDGGNVVALWHDADGCDVRDALDAIGAGEVEMVYLDDVNADIPNRYRQFVPGYVSRIWAARGLPATGPQRIEAAARAHYINRFFDTYGTSPRRSGITMETLLHGLLHQSRDQAK